MQDLTIDTTAAVPTTIKRFEDGDVFNTANNTTYTTALGNALGALQRTKAALIGQFVGTADPGGGLSSPLDTFSTTSFVSSATIKVTATNLKAGDIVVIEGTLLMTGDVATTSVELQLHDGSSRVNGWTFISDTAGGLPNSGSSSGAMPAPVYARYSVSSDAASKVFTIQGKKLAGGHNSAQTHSPWTLTATVYRA